MKTPEPPKIVFPCRYSLRIIGKTSPRFHEEVVAIVKRHVDDLDESFVKVKPSREGNFSSVFVVIQAMDEAHLAAIHSALMAHDAVKMVI